MATACECVHATHFQKYLREGDITDDHKYSLVEARETHNTSIGVLKVCRYCAKHHISKLDDRSCGHGKDDGFDCNTCAALELDQLDERITG